MFLLRRKEIRGLSVKIADVSSESFLRIYENYGISPLMDTDYLTIATILIETGVLDVLVTVNRNINVTLCFACMHACKHSE